jgi:hypothetical protein
MFLTLHLHRDYLLKPISSGHQTGYDWPKVWHPPDGSPDREGSRFRSPVIRKGQVWIATRRLNETYATSLKLNARRRSMSKLTSTIRGNKEIPRFPRSTFQHRMSDLAILPVRRLRRRAKINSPVRKAVTDVSKPPDILSLQ